MNKDFLEQITEVLLPERLGDAFQDNERYQAAISEENRLFECGLSADDIIEKLEHKLNVPRQNAKEYFQRFAAEAV